MKNIVDISTRAQFRNWLLEYHLSEKECWLPVRRGKTPPKDCVWYLDAVEEALCFGWIDSTQKSIDGIIHQRFGPRRKGGRWTELNKERCRRLEKLGLMIDKGRAACPDLDAEFLIIPEVIEAFEIHPIVWQNFKSFPGLYQRVRIDNIHRVRECKELFDSRLKKLIEASERGEMIGDWHDFGRLLKY